MSSGVCAGTLLLLLVLHGYCSIITVADVGTHTNVTSHTQRLGKHPEEVHKTHSADSDMLAEMREYVGDVYKHHTTEGRPLEGDMLAEMREYVGDVYKHHATEGRPLEGDMLAEMREYVGDVYKHGTTEGRPLEGDMLAEMQEYVGDVYKHGTTEGRPLQQLRWRWRKTRAPKFSRNWEQKTTGRRGGQALADDSHILWFQALLNSTLASFHAPVGRTSSSSTTNSTFPDKSVSTSRSTSYRDSLSTPGSTSSSTSDSTSSSMTAAVPPRMSRRVVTVEPGYMLVVKRVRPGQPHDAASADDLSLVSEVEQVELDSEEKTLKNNTVNDAKQTVLESPLTSQSSSETLGKGIKGSILGSLQGSQHKGIVTAEVSKNIPTESRDASKSSRASEIAQTEPGDTAESSAAVVTKLTDLHAPVSPSVGLLVADLSLTTGAPGVTTPTENVASSVTSPLENHSIDQKLEATTATQVTSLPRQQGVTVHRHRRQVDTTYETSTSGDGTTALFHRPVPSVPRQEAQHPVHQEMFFCSFL